jgi:hypothetical protein
VDLVLAFIDWPSFLVGGIVGWILGFLVVGMARTGRS